mgnify:CR=1 FL=1
MKRPTIDQFFPESTTPKDLNRVFLNNPELYRFIQALDGYIDWLESKVEDELRNEEITTLKTNYVDISVIKTEILPPNHMIIGGVHFEDKPGDWKPRDIGRK